MADRKYSIGDQHRHRANPATATRVHQSRRLLNSDDDVIAPPSSITTYDDRAPILWTHDDRPLVRRAGF